MLTTCLGAVDISGEPRKLIENKAASVLSLVWIGDSFEFTLQSQEGIGPIYSIVKKKKIIYTYLDYENIKSVN